jgi:hypothetical protein
MSSPHRQLVVCGLGQLGQLFGAAALAADVQVTPLLRRSDRAVLDDIPEDTPVLLTVGERDLGSSVASLPASRRSHLILVQNELFPSVWRDAGATEPTVAIVWISKKKGRPVEVGGPTRVFGRYAEDVRAWHDALDLPCEVLADERALGAALVSKYAFILTINALGVVENFSLGEWLERDESRVRGLIADATSLGRAHLGDDVDEDAVTRDVLAGMKALAHYPAKGRTAAARVERAKADAARFSLELGAIDAIDVTAAGAS